MKNKYSLKNKQRFNELIQTGKKYKNKNYVVYFLPSFELKIGITISKKMGNAPQRNYHKRVIRSICQQNMEKFEIFDYVIIGRENLKIATYQEKTKMLIEIFERIKNEKK